MPFSMLTDVQMGLPLVAHLAMYIQNNAELGYRRATAVHDRHRVPNTLRGLDEGPWLPRPRGVPDSVVSQTLNQLARLVPARPATPSV